MVLLLNTTAPTKKYLYICLVFSLFTIICYSTSTCLYCRRADITSAWLDTFSYCEATDTCLKDQHEYIN